MVLDRIANERIGTMAENVKKWVSRREFVRDAGIAAGVLAAGALAGCSSATTGGTTSGSASTGKSASSATASTASSGTASSAAATTLSSPLAIIHTNDTHGYDIETAPTDSTAGNFSMAAVPALKASYEAKGYQVILIDAGDAIQDTPLVDQSQGATAIEFMNACGYQLMALGNHEFDWGIDNLNSLHAQANFPFLSANVIDDATGAPLVDADAIIALDDGTKVGFFGLTTPTTQTLTNPARIAGLTFLSDDDLYACAQAEADRLRSEGCALVVCIGHLGGAGSIAPYRSYDVLTNTSGIDIFIDGHDHLVENAVVRGSLLAETGCYLHNIGVITYDEGVMSENLVAYGSFTDVDESAQALIDQRDDEMNQSLAVVVAGSAVALNGNRDPGVRTGETNLGDLIADAYRWDGAQATGGMIDCAIVNGGSIRTSIDAGDITLRMVKTVLPFDGLVDVVEVTGAQLLEALEAAMFQAPKALGAFPQVSGITCTVNTQVPYAQGAQYPDSSFYAPAQPGARVTIADVGGRGFSTTDTYTVAVTDFIAAGGDAYYAFKEAADAKQPTPCDFDYEAFVSYMTEYLGGTVGDAYAQPQGRLTLI